MNHTLLDSCKSSVDVPVDDHDAAGVDTLLEMSYTEILKMGFLLNWTAQNCNNCVTSGGLCGFNDNEFVCFCSDRSHGKTCDDGTSVVTFSLFSTSLNFQTTVVKISHSLCCSILFVDSHFCASSPNESPPNPKYVLLPQIRQEKFIRTPNFPHIQSSNVESKIRKWSKIRAN